MSLRATPLHVIPGETPGPDGRPLSPFARFADRIAQGGTEFDGAEHSVARLPDGSILVVDAASQPAIIRDGRSIPVPIDGAP